MTPDALSDPHPDAVQEKLDFFKPDMRAEALSELRVSAHLPRTVSAEAGVASRGEAAPSGRPVGAVSAAAPRRSPQVVPDEYRTDAAIFVVDNDLDAKGSRELAKAYLVRRLNCFCPPPLALPWQPPLASPSPGRLHQIRAPRLTPYLPTRPVRPPFRAQDRANRQVLSTQSQQFDNTAGDTLAFKARGPAARTASSSPGLPGVFRETPFAVSRPTLCFFPLLHRPPPADLARRHGGAAQAWVGGDRPEDHRQGAQGKPPLLHAACALCLPVSLSNALGPSRPLTLGPRPVSLLSPQYATSDNARTMLRGVLIDEEEAVAVQQAKAEATVQTIELESDEAAYRPIPLARAAPGPAPRRTACGAANLPPACGANEADARGAPPA